MIDVVMYTKNECSNCKRADMLFEFCPIDVNIIKKNIDVESKFMEELKEKDIMSVPSFVINGKWIEGFHEGKIMEGLGL